MNKTWVYKNSDPGKAREISSALASSEMLAALLLNRNIDSVKGALEFLNPDLSRLHNPFLLPDMEKAVLRARQAIDRKEKILVYGDRDVDGVTSIAVVVRTLKNLGADVTWTVPSTEGYGLHKPLLKKFRDEGARVVITVDCGTSAVEEIAYANSIGMEVVVTDHHLPAETLPPACAIVNPNLKDSIYPMKELAGCLTAFKFAQALMFTFNGTFNREFVVLDFETTGLSPLQDEIVEVGALRIRNFVPREEFHSLVKPSRPISAGAIEVHGITEDMVAGAPDIGQVLPRLVDFIGDRAIVAHNAPFDAGFLQQAARKVMGKELKNAWVDTLALSRKAFSFKSHSLPALARELDIEVSQAHRSMSDCAATARLFQKIEEKNDPRLQVFMEGQLDVAALGTIADVVPLTGENRVIVRHGLPHLLKTRKIGLKRLIAEGVLKYRKFSGADPEAPLTARDIAWGVAPLINAAGRFSKAELAAKLLLTDDAGEALRLVEEIADLNEDRKSLQKTNLKRFLKLAREQCDLEEDRLLFVVAEEAEHGVTGIVANQLMREFCRPVVLLIVQGEEAMGSSRSLPCFNVVDALTRCKDLLIKYGGHPQAAGLSVQTANVESLRQRLRQIALEEIRPDSLLPRVEIDMELDLDQVGAGLMEEIGKLEPFGEGNPAPVFAVRGIQVEEHSLMGAQKNHLRLKLAGNGKWVSAVGWGLSALAADLKKGDRIDAAFHLEMNGRENRDAPRLVLADLKKSSANETLELLF